MGLLLALDRQVPIGFQVVSWWRSLSTPDGPALASRTSARRHGNLAHQAADGVRGGANGLAVIGATDGGRPGQVGERLERERRREARLRTDGRLHLVITEGEHAAVGVVDEHNLPDPEQSLGGQRRADRVVAHNPGGSSDDAGVWLLKPQDPVDVQAGIHAGEYGDPLRRRHRQGPVSEGPRVTGSVLEQLVGD
jgi:hypothetical protein